MHAPPEAVQILHGPKRHQDRIAVQLLVPDLEEPDHLKLARQKDFVRLQPLQQQG